MTMRRRCALPVFVMPPRRVRSPLVTSLATAPLYPISCRGLVNRESLPTSVTIVAEVGKLSRFTKPRQLMGYSGAVASEVTSGERTRRGGITKTGNAHLRRIVIEAAWAYQHRPGIGPALRKRQATVSPAVRQIAWKAEHRLSARCRHLTGTSQCRHEVVPAVGR